MENLKFLQTSPRLDKDEARTSASENGLEKKLTPLPQLGLQGLVL
jgi:hypothetical protein